MSVKAIILGILKRGPLHGYDIKRTIEQEMGDWADIAFGSIYFALDKLSKDGFVTAETKESADHRPSRIVYTITPSGEVEYQNMLRELWQDTSRHASPLDIGVAFLRDLPRADVQGYLEKRIEYLERGLLYLTKHQEETLRQIEVPPESRFIFSHARYRLEAELAWTREVIEGV